MAISVYYTYICNTSSTDKKENLIFLIYKEIQTGSVAKCASSYMVKYIFSHFLIY